MPTLFDLPTRVRRPSLSQLAPALAALGALGVESLTVALVYTLQSAWLYASGTFLLRNAEPVTILGYAFATLFAFGSARWRGVSAAVGLFAVIWIEQFWLSVPGRQTFCDRSGTPCDLVAIAWPQLWPPLLGIALGILAMRAVRQGGPGSSALALGIGSFALSASLARIAFAPFLGFNPLGDAASGAINTVIAVQLAGALAAGLVVGIFGRRWLRDAFILLVFFVGPWSPQLRRFQDVPRPFILAIDWQLFTPVGYALVAVLGVGISAVAARYRATRVPTIP